MAYSTKEKLIAIVAILFLTMTFLSGCKKELKGDLTSWIGFTEEKIIINVTPETKLFRIEVEGTTSTMRFPDVYLDSLNTSAKHNIHFINVVDNKFSIGTVGEFTVIPNTNKSYKDVELIPENITKVDTISYMITNGLIYGDEPKTMIKRLMVILQPKSEK